jgi:hypothetical protein
MTWLSREGEGRLYDGEKSGAELGVTVGDERRGGDVACAAVDYEARLQLGSTRFLVFVFHCCLLVGAAKVQTWR